MQGSVRGPGIVLLASFGGLLLVVVVVVVIYTATDSGADCYESSQMNNNYKSEVRRREMIVHGVDACGFACLV